MHTYNRAKLMDGRPLARRILQAAAARITRIRERTGVTPTLATVVVGDNAASQTYVRMKCRRCDEVGMRSLRIDLPFDPPAPTSAPAPTPSADSSTPTLPGPPVDAALAARAAATTEKLLATIRALAADPAVHGILVQHPVPPPIDKRAAFEEIPPAKDVDGVTAATLGRVILGLPAFVPCTPAGIMRLLDEYHVALDGAHAIVIGRSPILGRPMASMLINRHATVTLCHSRTRSLPSLVREADVVIAAVGRPRFVQGGWIKVGAVVVDAGYNPGNVGDVDFDAAVEPASLITPVPGGVGPMTIATLIEQTTQAAAEQLGVAP